MPMKRLRRAACASPARNDGYAVGRNSLPQRRRAAPLWASLALPSVMRSPRRPRATALPAFLLLVAAPAAAQSPSLDDLALPGHKAADTLAALLQPIAPKSGGGLAVSTTTPNWTVPAGATLLQITLSPQETGVVFNGSALGETFGLMLPAGYNPAAPPPLVVAWHGYGVGPMQIFNGTALPAEANARGWMLMAPLGVADNSFSWIPGQQAVEKSLAWLRAQHPFDASRVYGAGFSMGANCILNYAARHQDPKDVTFAAVAGVCGSYDNIRVYNSDPAVQDLLELLFGGMPTQPTATFQYERTSTERVLGGAALEGRSLARALAKTPSWIAWSTDDDQVPYAPAGNTALVQYLQALQAPVVSHPTIGLAQPHSWDALDVAACFDWFATQQLPNALASFTILADRDANFRGVEISGATKGDFRRFDFLAIPGANRVVTSNSKNLSTLTLSITDFGLDRSKDWSFGSTTIDGSSDLLRVMDAMAPPSRVRRDGADVYDWEFNPAGWLELAAPPGTHMTQVLRTSYDMLLAQVPVPNECGIAWLTLAGAGHEDPYEIYFAESAGFWPLSETDATDPRWLMLNPSTILVAAAGSLAGGGGEGVKVTVPAMSATVGSKVRFQAITKPGSSIGLPFAVGRVSNPIEVSTELESTWIVPFRTGDRLTGHVECEGELDSGTFAALAGTILTLTVETPGQELAPSIEILDGAGKAVKSLLLSPGKKSQKRTVKLPTTGTYRVKITGASAGWSGDFEVQTSAKLPKGALGVSKKALSAPKLGGPVDLPLPVLSGASMAATIGFVKNKPPSGALTLSLIAPDGTAVDLSSVLQPLPAGGFQLTPLAATQTGTYRLRIAGLAPKEKVIVTASLAQPVGGASVELP